ncbi:MAG: hypothetical protein GEV03_18380 [Streptosporangiales bacterium]|nr:hypothetical protein [Streptosporangiales bacterium]
MLRPSTLIASGCLALLSVWRAADGAYGLAALFAALALANLGLGVWTARAGHGRAGPVVPGSAGSGPPAAEAERLRRIRAGWLGITLFGWAAAVVGAFTFPPMGLVLAALALYASLRYRRSGQLVRALEEAAAPDGGSEA